MFVDGTQLRCRHSPRVWTYVRATALPLLALMGLAQQRHAVDAAVWMLSYSDIFPQSTSMIAGSGIASAFASNLIRGVDRTSLNVAGRVSASNALPLFVLLVILVASMVVARVVLSKFRAAIMTIFSCRFMRCDFDVQTEEIPCYYGATLRAFAAAMGCWRRAVT